MSGEVEEPRVYEDLRFEDNQNDVTEKKCWKKWPVRVGAVITILFGVVCFGVGFNIAYFAVPGPGRHSMVHIVLFYLIDMMLVI